MTVIAVANPKGGVGKSTIATNLATMFAMRNRSVQLFDADPQKSSYKWGLLRDSFGVLPRISNVLPEDDMLTHLRRVQNDAEITIVDVMGARGAAMALALGAADITLVPVMPAQFEVWALDDAAELVRGVRNMKKNMQVYSFLNNVPPHPKSRTVRTTRAALNAYSSYFQPLDTAIIGRAVFGEALCLGMGVAEIDGGARDAKATENLNQFFAEVFE